MHRLKSELAWVFPVWAKLANTIMLAKPEPGNRTRIIENEVMKTSHIATSRKMDPDGIAVNDANHFEPCGAATLR